VQVERLVSEMTYNVFMLMKTLNPTQYSLTHLCIADLLVA